MMQTRRGFDANSLRIHDGSISASRARQIAPILVRQAKAGQSITYQTLARELGVHHRTLARALGCIASDIVALEKKTGREILPLTAIVVNKQSRLPGQGLFKGFRKHLAEYLGPIPAFEHLTPQQKQTHMKLLFERFQACGHWDWVLAKLGLEPLPADAPLANAIEYARKLREGGESQAHGALKKHVAAHPELFGLTRRAEVQVEQVFPSADRADVSFRQGDRWVVAEVKPDGSKEDEIVRGIYQCVKYRALMDAMNRETGLSPRIDAVLVLGGPMPVGAARGAHTLGVSYLERIGANRTAPRRKRLSHA